MNSFSLLGIIFVLGMSGSMIGCAKKPVETEPVHKINDTTVALAPNALKNISVTTAEMRPFPDLLNLMGRISVAEDRITVVPARAAGRLDAVFPSSGESVVQGQILANLYSPDFIAAREEYLSSMSKPGAPAKSSETEAEFKNLSQMAEKKLSSMGLGPQDIAKLRTERDHSTSSLVVRSPRAGFIIDKKAIVGNIVNMGDTLFTIADLRKVWFSGDLYPEDLPKVHKNQEVLIEAVGEDKPILGKISMISPVVDPNARTIKLRAMMDNAKNVLRADMYVQGSVILNDKTALLVPSSALIHSNNLHYCFKKVEDGQIQTVFQRVPVEVSNERNGVSAISQGLKPGDQVISEGALLLNAVLNTSGDKG